MTAAAIKNFEHLQEVWSYIRARQAQFLLTSDTGDSRRLFLELRFLMREAEQVSADVIPELFISGLQAKRRSNLFSKFPVNSKEWAAQASAKSPPRKNVSELITTR